MLTTDLKYHKSWKDFIDNSKYLVDMVTFVSESKNICPKKEDVFRFFNCDLDNTKCIILGMDPYPSTYVSDGAILPVATGRAFEVANVVNFTDKYKQSSLSKIFKTLWYYKYGEILGIDEIRKKIGVSRNKYINIHNWFDGMEKEGVIFLNATLTTEIGRSGVHVNLWKLFMDELILFILGKNSNIKWLIWGEQALNRVENLVKRENIIYTCHPASRVKNTFVEDCCFKKVEGIEWF